MTQSFQSVWGGPPIILIGLAIAAYQCVTPILHANDSHDPYVLWDASQPVPKSDEVPLLATARCVEVKRHAPDEDGFNWLHGAAIIRHDGLWHVSFGLNAGNENTPGEVAYSTTSIDGVNWRPLIPIENGPEGDLGVTHGVFVSDRDMLWAFHGGFHGRLKQVHTRAYALDEQAREWKFKGVVAEFGFLPLQTPLKMDDGNWIMAGISATNFGGPDNPPAVAISAGDDFTQWKVIRVPKPDSMHVWGESTIIVDGHEILLISRYRKPIALASVSEDYGRTWTMLRESNLPMAASKPYAGLLSTGQRYLIGTTTTDTGQRRSPLTIAVSAPGEKAFSRVFRIRDAVHNGPGESHPQAALAYPCVVEHEGHLWVVFSNDGGRGKNLNSCELAIVPLTALESTSKLQ